MNDEEFLDHVADRLAGLPGVRAVTLGGSRAQGTHTPESDWDLAVYYRGRFDPDDLRAVGWPGRVSEIGEWGGVFNGGAWFTIDGRRVDVHYRDLDVVEHRLAEAERGRFRVEPLLFHLAGIPTYPLVAGLAANRVRRGELPRPDGYPPALRRNAPPRSTARPGRAARATWERPTASSRACSPKARRRPPGATGRGAVETVLNNLLSIVATTAEKGDNVCRIFESINNTGAGLSQSDLLGNWCGPLTVRWRNDAY